jgi:hypothetical protein
MTRKHVVLKGLLLASLLMVVAASFSGCRYTANRLYDFADIFQFGAGVTSENSGSGMIPPALGVHVQATDFVNLGVSHFSGLVAEWDGRGFYAGPEDHTRIGFLPIQVVHYDQPYELGCENYFKKPDSLWNDRMNSIPMRFAHAPAKELEYSFWADCFHQGAPLFYRGWQYWENVAVEVGVCEPFLTHLGVHLRAGFDASEIMDFLLGIACVDFKYDDLTCEEFEEACSGWAPVGDHKPPSDAVRPMGKMGKMPPPPKAHPMWRNAPPRPPERPAPPALHVPDERVEPVR